MLTKALQTTENDSIKEIVAAEVEVAEIIRDSSVVVAVTRNHSAKQIHWMMRATRGCAIYVRAFFTLLVRMVRTDQTLMKMLKLLMQQRKKLTK